ncbi:DNA topoisomerase 3-beta [Arachis hypogaea]|nr:DNA topoisomerase 3-beta [Arachis hypogaea]
MFTRRVSTEVHEFDGVFFGSPVQFKVTSVIGHVFRFSSQISRLGSHRSVRSF